MFFFLITFENIHAGNSISVSLINDCVLKGFSRQCQKFIIDDEWMECDFLDNDVTFEINFLRWVYVG
jgi:hypothetical protein